MVRLTPHRFRLGLDTALGAEDGHAAVQNAQAALHLGGEVHMTRGIDDVDARILPEAGGSRAGDGDARSCSCTIQSIVALPSWVSPIL